MAGTEGAFDVEAMISEFLADPARTFLELPRMTTGQRKQARKLAEQHTELKCESFGLAADRRLHLFKVSAEGGDADKEAAAPAEKQVTDSPGGRSPKTPLVAGAYNVKNTFIDGWADAEEDSKEPVVFRSFPPRLPERAVHTREIEPLPQIGERAGADSRRAADSRGEDSPGTSRAGGRSCRAFLPAGLLRFSGGETPLTRGGETPLTSGGKTPLPEGLQVRNTFICDVAEERADDRAVQSMPHGMFRQCLFEDLQAVQTSSPQAPSDAPAAAAPPAEEPAPAEPEAPHRVGFAPGEEVVIEGLLKLPAFNGLCGTVQAFDERTGRYDVLLPAPGPTGQRRTKVKGENLRAAPPLQPPCFTPLLTPSTPEAWGGLGLPAPAAPLWERCGGAAAAPPMRAAAMA